MAQVGQPYPDEICVLLNPKDARFQIQSRMPTPRRPGTRAYLSAGLPGAEWWVAGAAADRAEDANVELDEVERFCTEHDLWHQRT